MRISSGIRTRFLKSGKFGAIPLVISTFAIYPVLYFWPLMGGSLTDTYGNKPSDLNGTLQLAVVLKQMSFPWSHNQYTGFPSGEGFWRWQTFTQSAQVAWLWLLTRIASPQFAVNTFIILGWTLTGVAAFVLCRRLKLNLATSVFASLTIQMLPWIREKSWVHVNHVNLAPLLLTVAVLVAVYDKNKPVPVTRLCAPVLFAAFWDPYWLQFALLVILLTAVSNPTRTRELLMKLSRRARVVMIGIAATCVSSCVFLVIYDANRREKGLITSVAFGVASRAQIDNRGGTLLDFVRPDYRHLLFPFPPKGTTDFVADTVNYVGAINIAFAIIACILIVRSRGRDLVIQSEMLLVKLCALLVFSSLQTQIDLGFFRISTLSDSLRFIMPGIRFFTRVSMLAAALLVILAFMAIETMVARRSSRRALRLLSAGLLFVFGSLDLNPLSRREVVPDRGLYRSFDEALSQTRDPVFLSLPTTGRSRVDQSYLQYPTYNSLYYALPNIKLEKAADLGPENLARFLSARGITHVISTDPFDQSLPDWDRVSFLFRFEEPYFKELVSETVSGSYVSYKIRLTLFEVVPQPVWRCGTCREGYLGKVNLGGKFLPPENSASWLQPGSGTLRIVPTLQSANRYSVSFGLSSLGTPQSVVLTVGGRREIVHVPSGPAQARISFTMLSSDEVSVRTMGRCATPLELGVSQDARQLCVSLSGLTFSPLKK